MVSPELLRRFPFFARFTDQQLIEIAMIADQISVAKDTVIFEECMPAETLYLLLTGSVELFYTSQEEYHPKDKKEFSIGDINPGEVFSISSMIEPYKLNASARATHTSEILTIDAQALRSLMEKDCEMGFITLQQITKALMERLMYTRVQLAAAWA